VIEARRIRDEGFVMLRLRCEVEVEIGDGDDTCKSGAPEEREGAMELARRQLKRYIESALRSDLKERQTKED